MTPLRIMHINGNLRLGGAEKLTATIVEYLNQEDFTASVCCLAEGGYYGNQLRERGFSVYEIGCTRASSLWGLINVMRCILALRSLLIQNRIDIVHTQSFGSGVVGRIAAKLAAVSITVHTVHGLDAYGPLQPWIERALAYITTAYVVDSNAVRQRISNNYSIDASKISVIYNGINPEEFDNLTSKQAARNELGIPQDNAVITILARMTKAKAHEIYIKAFAQVLTQYPNACLLLAGDGETRHDLEQLVKQLGIKNKVFFLGYREDPAFILSATNILAHPSEWEGFGIVYAEAMYCQIPVVASNVGGGAEVIAHLETGILVPVGDVDGFARATLSLLNDKVLVARYGTAGRMRAEKLFVKDKMIEQYEQFYRQLVVT